MASGVGSIGGTVLGVFNSACEQIWFDDDSGINTESSTAVQVPDDGIVVVAATGFPDYGFAGNTSNKFGSYELSISDGTGAFVSGNFVTQTVAGLPMMSPRPTSS